MEIKKVKKVDVFSDEVHDFIDEEVYWAFSDCEEIGSSDVSMVVSRVVKSLDIDNDMVPVIRAMVYRSIRNFKGVY